MSFSTKVKEEIEKHSTVARHCQIAELLALTLASGEVMFSSGNIYLRLFPENKLAYNKICRLTDILFNKEITYDTDGKNIVISDPDTCRRFLTTVKLADAVDEMAQDWLDDDELEENLVDNEILYVSTHGISLENCRFPRQVILKDCCKKAFLRGLFLNNGSVNDPNKAYHFEIVLRNKDMAGVVKEIITGFSLEAKIVKRKKYYVVYLKEGSMIVDMLNIMEAYVSLMDMENIRILKDMRNNINRQVNCETANIKKTVGAARRQIEDIQYIEKTKGLKYLNDSLREIAELRLEQPDADLALLGTMLEPPISKSGVNHRLRKIGKIAEELRQS
ncbi:MAG: DNA-binding protein WhiA [Lachnospiraceae bacterium]|nr:DNA-binding protein WhiA [Lachnospiraceae bacterium]